MDFFKIPFLILLLSLLLTVELKAEEYQVAVRAHHGIEEATQQWQPTIDTLNEQIKGHHFSLLPIINLKEISARAARKEFDFLLTNPSSFVETKQLHGAKALATLNNKRANTGQDRFGSVVFTHAKNVDILTFSDLEDKSLMVVSEQAFGGWRIAWLEMLEQGFDPKNKLKHLKFAKSRTQAEVVYAVINGSVDAGVVRTDLLERLEASRKIDMRYVRVLNNKDVKTFPFFLSTKLYPEWVFSALKHIPDRFSKQVADVLLSISKESQAALAGKYMGWIRPKDYTSVQKLM
ncbi:MAG: phosphate/phosphite/phosphonate ABC transporter substrate-binding protein, partial [Gammaproteobacteria bacterium]|nr:phosphate/phosphite/phosphonate ABC transporter substrate-binding protein [Gammaproteobacteria bacterium]